MKLKRNWAAKVLSRSSQANLRYNECHTAVRSRCHVSASPDDLQATAAHITLARTTLGRLCFLVRAVQLEAPLGNLSLALLQISVPHTVVLRTCLYHH